MSESESESRAPRPATWAIGALVASVAWLAAAPAVAQVKDARTPPPITRWVDVQTLTIYSRYRFIQNSKDVTTANQLQYKEAIRARFNVDRGKKITLNAGLFSGSSFISTWNNWGPGTGSFDGKNNYLKQLFLAVAPGGGVEVQAGGIYVRRGEDDDITTYDEDGYIVGERASIRRPAQFYLDEITVTHGALGPFNAPNLWTRWDGFTNPNYTQALAMKRFNRVVAGSLDYSTQSGARTVRAAVAVHLPRTVPFFSTVKYEQYRRVTEHPAAGFALWTEGPLTRHARLQLGYVTIDQFYGGWNADRIQSGRRFMAIGTIPLPGGFNAQLFGTEALSSRYSIPLKRRYEAVISYDLLTMLRKQHVL